MKKNGILILLVCFLSIILLGCNANDSETMDVCSLITKEEAETAIDMAVDDGEFTEQEALGQRMCFYDGKEDTIGASFVQISILRTEEMPKKVTESGQTAKTIYADIKDNIENKASIEGLGDDAFWGTNGLYVLKGDAFFNIGVGNSDRPENMEISKGLAEIVLERF